VSTSNYYWCRWLEDALRADSFVSDRLIVWPGWETRGRPPTSFSFLPTGQVCHHTACMLRIGHDPTNCANSIIAGRADAPGPISQLLGTFTPPGTRWNGANADPHILLLAAGRANHAGTGIYPWGAPGGNGGSIGWEWCGPPVDGWPDIVTELYERGVAAVCRRNGWSARQVTTHHEYATPPGRKIDPSSRTTDEPGLGLLTPWSARKLRDRIANRLSPPPSSDPLPSPPGPEPGTGTTPTPEPLPVHFISAALGGDDDMLHILANEDEPGGRDVRNNRRRWLSNGLVVRLPQDQAEVDFLIATKQIISVAQAAGQGGFDLLNPRWVSTATLAGYASVNPNTAAAT
jgi:hypothetical protein